MVLAGLFVALTAPVRADRNVVVVGAADPAYSARKYDAQGIRRATYVVMQGRYFDGLTVDKSIERATVRHILEFFAPQLARRQYWPAASLAEADLLILVHWGTTRPAPSYTEMHAMDLVYSNPNHNAEVQRLQEFDARATEDDQNALVETMARPEEALAQQWQMENLSILGSQLESDVAQASNANLLGYAKELRRLSEGPADRTTEHMLRFDLASERYFIILKAYDLREKRPATGRRRAAWTLHLNMRAPGINFHDALKRMSTTAVNYFGRSTDKVETVYPGTKEGRVEIGAPVVVEPPVVVESLR